MRRRHANLHRELSEACSRSITKKYSFIKNNFIDMANDNTVLSRENYICSYILSWSSMQNMVMSFISFIKNNFIDMANDNTVHTFRPDTRWRIWWWVLFHLLKIILLIWQTTTQFSPERTIFVHTFRPDPRWRIWRV